MLRFFRINDPYRLLGLLLILFLIYLPYMVHGIALTIPELRSLVVGESIRGGAIPYSSLIDSTGPFSAWIFSFVDLIMGRSLAGRHILAFALLFLQSAYFGTILINKKAFAENTYIPSFLFSVLTFFSFDTISLTTELFGCGFLLLALNNLFKEIEFRTQRDETIFNLGLFISFASLCDFSFSVHLFAVITILSLYTRTALRGFLLLIFGFALPHLVVMSLYYLNNHLADLMANYYLPNLAFGVNRLVSWHTMLVLGGVPLGFFLISIVMLNREARFTKYQSQLLQTMFFWLVFSFIQVSYASDMRPQSYIVLIPGMCFFLTHFLLIIRRKRLAELATWLILLGIVAVSYLSFYKSLNSVDYTRLFVGKNNYGLKDKKVLILSEDLSPYQDNVAATAFIDWNLSKDIFTNPNFYDNVIRVDEAFKRDAPQVIIDPDNFMPAFFERLPALKVRYKMTAKGVYALIGSSN